MRRGYVGVKAEHVFALGPVAAQGQPIPLVVKIQITEGPRTLIRTVSFAGREALNAERLNAVIKIQPGQPRYDPLIGADREAIVLRYLNRGYAEANVEALITPTADGTEADVHFKIVEGAQIFVDQILVVGNVRASTALITQEITLRPGEPLGASAMLESQRKLSALGLFRRVRITELPHSGDDRRRDVLVTVEEAALTTFGFGGGVEGGQQLRRASGVEGAAETVFQVAPRGFIEIGRRNLWGRNRSVNLFTRVTLRPRNATTSSDPTAPQGGYGFNGSRVLGTLRDPKIFNTPADALVTGFIEQGVRTSFNFARRAIQTEIARRLRP